MSNNDQIEVSMIQECVHSYDVQPHSDGRITVTIEIPKRFADLWLVKLSELKATHAEISEYEPPPD
jgi:hypothetical protein